MEAVQGFKQLLISYTMSKVPDGSFFFFKESIVFIFYKIGP